MPAHRAIFRPCRFLAAIACLAVPSRLLGEDPFAGYLFAYFTGNDKSQEAIRFALSDDGFNYKALNKGNPVVSSAAISATGGVRDPHILRGQSGDYYMVATDMVSANGWNSNHGMVLLKSTNLVDWTSAKVDIRTAFPAFAAADRVWAPQTIWDPAAGKYMVYFAMRLGGSDIDKIYWSYANASFTALETAPKVLYTYDGKAAIDGDIVLKDSTYHLFFKTEGNGNGIKSATSKSLTGPYVLIDRYLQPTTKAVEGSCAFKLTDSDTWILMYDLYMDGKYQFAISTNLLDFVVSARAYSFDFTPRHGTVVPVTAQEKAALNAKWNPSANLGPASRDGNRRVGLDLAGRGVSIAASPGTTVSLVEPGGRIVRSVRLSNASGRLELGTLPGGIYQVVGSPLQGASWTESVIVQ